mmetsp:Transcript_29809/g.81793  ORF Transcript_29809/g.81793 Transcript_29809/m.81793 type:complete len:381 (+) Transcript_29809:419-1561(+)
MPMPMALPVPAAMRVGLIGAVRRTIAMRRPVAVAVAMAFTMPSAMGLGNFVLDDHQLDLSGARLFGEQLGCVEGFDREEIPKRDLVGLLRQATLPDRNESVYAPDDSLRLIDVFPRARVDLVQQQLVGEAHLLRRLVYCVLRPLAVQLCEEMLAIHHGQNAVDLAVLFHNLVLGEGVDDWAWVRHARRFDEDAVQQIARLCVPVFNLRDDVGHGLHEVVTNGATKAAVVEHRHRLHRLLLAHCLVKQLVVDGHVSELVLDDCILLPMVGGEDVIQKRCLAGAEEACQNGARDLPDRQQTGHLLDAPVAVGGCENGRSVVQLDLVGDHLARRPVGVTPPVAHHGARRPMANVALHAATHLEAQRWSFRHRSERKSACAPNA